MRITKIFVVLMVWNMIVTTNTKSISKEGKSRNRNLESNSRWNATSARISPDPLMTHAYSDGMPGALETDFDKSIEDMVSQVRNNPNLSINKCVVDRKLWMSNSRSLSPWSYRINHDENRKPVDIPEAVCLCMGCINPFTMQEDRTMTSALIYSKIPVRRLMCPRPNSKSSKKKRRKKKMKCVPRYRSVVENVAVGCTCIVG